MITAQDLIDLMPIVADVGWKKLNAGQIRDEFGRCPLCALANAIDKRISYSQAATMAFVRLGLKDWESSIAVNSIIGAADNADDPLRQRLMRALGMKK